MEQTPSSEADSHSSGKEISYTLWKTIALYNVHKFSLPDIIRNKMNGKLLSSLRILEAWTVWKYLPVESRSWTEGVGWNIYEYLNAVLIFNAFIYFNKICLRQILILIYVQIKNKKTHSRIQDLHKKKKHLNRTYKLHIQKCTNLERFVDLNKQNTKKLEYETNKIQHFIRIFNTNEGNVTEMVFMSTQYSSNVSRILATFKFPPTKKTWRIRD